MTPFEGTTSPGYFAPDKEPVREAVNDWIRHSGEFDAVIDFDRAIRDPAQPHRMLPAYDSATTCIRTTWVTRRWPRRWTSACSATVTTEIQALSSMARGVTSASARRAAVAVLAIGVLAVAGVALARYVRGMRARSARHSAVLVTFGDSLTEGGGSTRVPWPEILAERLEARSGGSSVVLVNAGISGNRLLSGGMGRSGLERFGPDVLERPGVRWVTVLEGTNDLGFPGALEPGAPPVTAEQLVAAYARLVERAQVARVKIYGGTLPPFEGAEGGYFTPEKERVRQSVNGWLRTSGRLDAVLDFDLVLRDPGHPARLLPAYDSGDHLHPNDAGHRAMGESVDLRLFDPDG